MFCFVHRDQLQIKLFSMKYYMQTIENYKISHNTIVAFNKIIKKKKQSNESKI